MNLSLSIFAWISIESIIKDNQEEYYNTIAQFTNQVKSNVFILFILDVINKAIKDIIVDLPTLGILAVEIITI